MIHEYDCDKYFFFTFRLFIMFFVNHRNLQINPAVLVFK